VKKILFLFGTRPEAIKMAPVIHEFKRDSSFVTVCCNSGQHKEMIEPVIDFFELQIDYELNVMKPDQNLSKLSASLLSGVDELLNKIKPDLILIHGDTTTSFCGALAAFYNKVPIGHIEAGLRTHDKFSPFPEEMNRNFSGYLSNIHFAPTKKASDNLHAEGITNHVYLTGNTIVDALHLGLQKLKERNYTSGLLKLIDQSKKQILVTQHRRENFGESLHEILEALLALASRSDVQIIFPVHLNPNVRTQVNAMLKDHPSICLVEPLSYPDLLWIMNRCHFIITDSGGIQEESPSLKKPFLVTREVTERPEAIESGAGFLVGSDKEKIISLSVRFLEDSDFYHACVAGKNPYGEGDASSKILKAVKEFWGA
jgi:UDP-N-acetylglucosamine 2-epimerase (non-hydrolysing)